MSRSVRAFFASRKAVRDPAYEREFAAALRHENAPALYGRFKSGESAFDAMMRRILVRAMVKRMGDGVEIAPDVRWRNPETVEIGSHVFIGSQAYIQGRHDGRCRIGSHVWIGPHAFFDARDLVIEDWVGWGPGAKVLGSAHTGVPKGVPIIRTDLVIKGVRIGRGADVGVNAVILPGVRVGAGAMVGAGAVVTSNVAADTVVAGVPARVLRKR